MPKKSIMFIAALLGAACVMGGDSVKINGGELILGEAKDQTMRSLRDFTVDCADKECETVIARPKVPGNHLPSARIVFKKEKIIAVRKYLTDTFDQEGSFNFAEALREAIAASIAEGMDNPKITFSKNKDPELPLTVMTLDFGRKRIEISILRHAGDASNKARPSVSMEEVME